MSNEIQNNLSQWIEIEDKSIYDGWCAKLNLNTGEVVWRDAWFVDRLSNKSKQDLEFQWRKLYYHNDAF